MWKCYSILFATWEKKLWASACISRLEKAQGYQSAQALYVFEVVTILGTGHSFNNAILSHNSAMTLVHIQFFTYL
jgi:hypothetical protein